MEEKDVYAELSSIRNLMERSSKFISLSGLAGVLVGFYALAAAWFVARITMNHEDMGSPSDDKPIILRAMILGALFVLLLTMLTSYWLSR